MKIVIIAVCFIIMLWTVSIGQHNTQSSGIIQVKFKKEYQHTLDTRQTSSGRLDHRKIGIQKFDALVTTTPIHSLKRLFRHSGKFENSHRAFELHLWYQIEFATTQNIQSIIKQYKSTNIFDVVEVRQDYVHEKPGTPTPPLLTTETFEPNDPLFDNQWHYSNQGQSGGTAGADISLKEAWALEKGSDEVIVAIIDGGIDISHPDLAATLWVNNDEISGNGIDDDLNGYIDDINGYNFGDDTGVIFPNYHGTHVAGTVGAITNNGIGVSGVAGGSGTADGVRLMSCATFGSFANGGFEEAMVYAADHGAVISQNSWSGGSSAIEAAIDYFIARAGFDNSNQNFEMNIQTRPLAGGLVIFSAGNENSLIGYPGSYEPVLAVASTDDRDSKSTFSNYGSWVDISAPGSMVYSTYPVELGSYAHLSGTSMACPHVSGVAALIISKFGGPGYLPAQVFDRLVLTATNINVLNSGYENLLGSGRLNAHAALAPNDNLPPLAIADLAKDSIEFDYVMLTWTATGGNGSDGRASFYELRYSTTPFDEFTFELATTTTIKIVPKIAGSVEHFPITGLLPSTTYYIALKAVDFSGNKSEISNVVTIITPQPPVANVLQHELTATLFSGQSSQQTITVQNNGNSTLSWSLTKMGLDSAGAKIEAKPFQLKASSPEPLTCIALDPRTGIVYGQGNYWYSFYAYQPQTDSWSALRPSPLYSANNGGAVFLNGKIYTAYTGQDTLGIYDIATNTWSKLASSFPTGNITTDGTNIYLLKHEWLMRYDPTSQQWASMPSPPFQFSMWGGISHYNKKLYAHGGDGSTLAAQFSIDDVSWTMLPNIPGKAVMGGTFDSLSQQYYTYGPYDGSLLYSYDIEENSWNKTVIPFFGVHDGGMASSPLEKGIYFVQGESGTGFGFYKTPLAMPWAKAQVKSGIVKTSSQETVTIDFNASGLLTGTYHGQLHIISNDPETDTVTVNVALTVIGIPKLEVNPSSVDFGEVFVGDPISSSVHIKNTGTDKLIITDVITSSDKVSVSENTIILEPGNVHQFQIEVSSTEATQVHEAVTLVSNDPEQSELIIDITGVVLEPPIISVPSSLSVQLQTGETKDIQLELTNAGGSNLFYKTLVGRTASNHLKDLIGKRIGLIVTTEEKYDTLVFALESRGATVSFINLPLTETSFTDISAMLVDDKISSFISSDISRISSWLNEGGRLLLSAGDPTSVSSLNALTNGTGIWSFALSETASGHFTDVTEHEVTEGVDSLVSNSYTLALSLSGNAFSLVRDNANRSHIALTEIGGGKAIVIANDITIDSEIENPETRLLVNRCIDWLVGNHYWLFANDVEGAVEENSSTRLSFEIDTQDFTEGAYSTLLFIRSNDPATPFLSIPVLLTIQNNTPPSVLIPIDDQILQTTQTWRVKLDTIFTDTEGDLLTYQASVDNNQLITAFVQEDVLNLQPLLPGATTITLTAMDTLGLSVSTSFDMSIILITDIDIKNDTYPILYPNPATDLVAVEYKLSRPSDISLSIYDVTGRWVATPVNSLYFDKEFKTSFSVKDLSSGTYVYHVMIGDNRISGKLIIR